MCVCMCVYIYNVCLCMCVYVWELSMCMCILYYLNVVFCLFGCLILFHLFIYSFIHLSIYLFIYVCICSINLCCISFCLMFCLVIFCLIIFCRSVQFWCSFFMVCLLIDLLDRLYDWTDFNYTFLHIYNSYRF